MRLSTILIGLLFACSCTNNPPQNSQTTSLSNLLDLEFHSSQFHELTDTIRLDMNSDGLPEKIYFFSKERHRGIQIENSETEELVTLGLSESIIPGNNLDWVEYWGITTDSSTYEITFNELNEVEGQRIVSLSLHRSSYAAERKVVD